MVEFSEDAFAKEDHLFVKEDPGRIYRGLKDILVNEFQMDRIEEARNEFDVSQPKDKIRLHAYKEKSPHTLIHYKINLRAKSPKMIYKQERNSDVLKAKIDTFAEVKTFYPGRDPIEWMPKPVTEQPFRNPEGGGLNPEETSAFQKSKLYRVLVGIWHNKFYSKEIHRYEEEAEETTLRIHDLLREKFGVEKTIGASGRSHYRPNWG